MTDTLEQFAAVHKDGMAEINGREYELAPFVHAERRKVFAYFTSIGKQLEGGDMRWIDTPDFAVVEKLIAQKVLVDGVQLSKLPEHWDSYPQDYLPFCVTMLGAISYPFMQGNAGS